MMTNTFETGGSERQFVVVASGLRNRGFCVEIGCLARLGPFQDGLGEIKEYPCGGSLYARRSWQSRGKLACFMRSHRIQIAHAFDFYTNLMLVPAARLGRVPVVLGSHRQLGDLLTPLQFRAQTLVLRLCDKVICNSRAAKQTLINQGLPEHKIAVIFNALPQEAFVQTQLALPRSSAVLRIGMIGRMNNPSKNFPCFLRAAARLVPKFPTLEFLLVGDGPLRPGLELMAQNLGLDRNVRFLGDRRDIPAILASMDISALTSSSESLSNVIIESMAAGLPVVATLVGGNSELVRESETGYLVPADNDAQFADALERLITQPELRARFSKKAKEIAKASFSLDRVMMQYEELYRSLLPH